MFLVLQKAMSVRAEVPASLILTTARKAEAADVSSLFGPGEQPQGYAVIYLTYRRNVAKV